MAFVIDWKRKLGYNADPFERERHALVGREEERKRLNIFIIKQQRFGTISGGDGTGKSALLSWLREELRQHKLDVISVSGAATHEEFLAPFLHRGFSFYERFTKPKHSKREREDLAIKRTRGRVVLLIDDAEKLSKEEKEFLQHLLEARSEVQLIIALPRVLKEHASYGEDALALELEPLGEEIVPMLAKRIALVGGVGTFPFAEADLKKIAKQAKGDAPRALDIAREQAIERSLKVEGPPTPQHEDRAEAKKESTGAAPVHAAEAASEPLVSYEEPQVTHTPSEKPGERGKFSIRFVKRRDDAAITIGASEDPETEDRGEQRGEQVQDDMIDVDLLNSIVSETAKETSKPEINTVIEEISEEMKRGKE